MNSDQLKNRAVRRAGRRKRTVLKLNELGNQVFTVPAGFKPVSELCKVNFGYLLPAISTGKGEVYLDEADLVALVE